MFDIVTSDATKLSLTHSKLAANQFLSLHISNSLNPGKASSHNLKAEDICVGRSAVLMAFTTCL